MNIQEAMKIVTREIANDPGYKIGWQANIAMTFVDEMAANSEDKDPAHLEFIHLVANKAATRFLDLLCMDANKETAKELADKWNKEREEAPYALD